MFGSSPLTRGKLVRRLLGGFRWRLIPAHAGKTASASQPSSSCAAHPRSRGENDRAVGHADRGEGSSPLTRGKLPPGQDQAVVDRLIPAHAGKTGCESVLRGAHEAHPRSRGENATNEDPASAYSGSSPLTRGKRSRVPSRFPRPRLIPAHAGKTYLLHRLLSLVRAHPRSRGENRPIPRAAPWTTGSSPLTRGKRVEELETDAHRRLIPAHAGKTTDAISRMYHAGAHPRSRGENLVATAAVDAVCGSSPLTRGKRDQRRPRQRLLRLIPAHAGKTAESGCDQRSTAAHPRSRGENLPGVAGAFNRVGSSPLTRGKHGGGRGLSRAVGLIPAHAGKTWRVLPVG